MRCDEAFDDRKAEAGAAVVAHDVMAALSEVLEDTLKVFIGDAGNSASASTAIAP